MRSRIIGFHMLGGAVIGTATVSVVAGSLAPALCGAMLGCFVGLVPGLISAALAPRSGRRSGFWLSVRLLAPAMLLVPGAIYILFDRGTQAACLALAVALVTAVTGWAAIPLCLDETGPNVTRRAILGLCLPGAIAVAAPLFGGFLQ